MNRTEQALTAATTSTHAGCVNLLWTGGWDSTFRLLQLLLLHRVAVTPHYLEDATRPSTSIELETIARIGEHLREAYPHTRELLRPLRVSPVATIPEDYEVNEALRQIRERVFIGSQYAWLPAYCRVAGLDDIELGVHIDDKVQALVRPFALEFEHACGFRSVRVDPRYADTPEYVLFHDFSFPLFHIDKVGIDREANARDWGAIMDMTWFCHRPVRGKPCGICAPCVYTIEEGLARRVPPMRRVLSYFYRRFALPLKEPLQRMRASWHRTPVDDGAATTPGP